MEQVKTHRNLENEQRDAEDKKQLFHSLLLNGIPEMKIVQKITFSK